MGALQIESRESLNRAWLYELLRRELKQGGNHYTGLPAKDGSIANGSPVMPVVAKFRMGSISTNIPIITRQETLLQFRVIESIHTHDAEGTVKYTAEEPIIPVVS